MTIRHLAGAAIAMAMLAAPMHAQGGLNKVANNISKTVKRPDAIRRQNCIAAGAKRTKR